MQRGLDDIFQGGQVWKKVKALKYHADLFTLLGNNVFLLLYQFTVSFTVSHHAPEHIDATAVNIFQMINAAQ